MKTIGKLIKRKEFLDICREFSLKENEIALVEEIFAGIDKICDDSDIIGGQDWKKGVEGEQNKILELPKESQKRVVSIACAILLKLCSVARKYTKTIVEIEKSIKGLKSDRS